MTSAMRSWWIQNPAVELSFTLSTPGTPGTISCNPGASAQLSIYHPSAAVCTCCPAGSPSTQLPRDDAPSAWTMTPNPCGVQPTRSCQRVPGHSPCMLDSILDMTRFYHVYTYLVCTCHSTRHDVTTCTSAHVSGRVSVQS